MISKLFKFLLNYYASLRGIEAQRTASLKAASNTQTKRNPLPHCTTTTTSVVPLLSVYSGMLWISPFLRCSLSSKWRPKWPKQRWYCFVDLHVFGFSLGRSICGQINSANTSFGLWFPCVPTKSLLRTEEVAFARALAVVNAVYLQ